LAIYTIMIRPERKGESRVKRGKSTPQWLR